MTYEPPCEVTGGSCRMWWPDVDDEDPPYCQDCGRPWDYSTDLHAEWRARARWWYLTTVARSL